MASASKPLRDAAGRERGALVVSELPRGARLASAEPIALMEGQRYRYELQGITEVAEIEPAEFFEPDDFTSRHGRINCGQSVGKLLVVVRGHDAVVMTAEIDIVPTKIAQIDEYRRMLSDITTHAAEAVLQGFAPTALNAAVGNRSTDLLYQ